MVSTFQHPFYPYSGMAGRSERMVNIPLAAGSGGEIFRKAVSQFWMPGAGTIQTADVVCFGGLRRSSG